MPVTIILNPYANRWGGLKQKNTIRESFQNAGIEIDLLETEDAGHGTELAYQAVENGTDAVFAAGGDGTLNEVLNGVMQSPKGPVTPFGIVPIGTANDFVDNLEMPYELDQVAALYKSGSIKKVDLITVNGRHFANNAGLGLEPYMSTIQVRITKIRGIARYLLATLKAIMDNPSWEMTVEWDSGSYEGLISLISIGNNPRTGGVFYTCPSADPFDGKLTFIYGLVDGRIQKFRTLPMLFNAEEGNITEHPQVHEIHSSWLKVKTTPTSPAHADGEIFTFGESEFHFEVQPGKLTLIA